MQVVGSRNAVGHDPRMLTGYRTRTYSRGLAGAPASGAAQEPGRPGRTGLATDLDYVFFNDNP